MKTSSLFLFALSLALLSFRSDKPAYMLFDNEGKETTYQEMIENVSSADVVFFGELHDNPISHWLEYEVTADLHLKAGTGLVLGAEMFEADDQLILDEYLTGRYAADKFEAEVKLWKNYKTDYRPLVEFAWKNGLPFIATNIPRRYASMVSRGGFEVLDSLTDGAKKLMAPLPVPYDPELKCYKDMMSMHGMPGSGGRPNENFPKAQAAKDATMAHFIVSNLKQGQTFIHFNGAYHSENYQGIIHYLKLYRPEISVATITTVIQDEIETLHPDNKGLADFIIAVPQSMTRTY